MEEVNNQKKNVLTSKNVFEILLFMFIVIFANNQRIPNNLFSLLNMQIDNRILQELLRNNDSDVQKTSVKSAKSSVSAKNHMLPLNTMGQIKNVTYDGIDVLVSIIIVAIVCFLVGIIRSIYNKSRKREILCCNR